MVGEFVPRLGGTKITREVWTYEYSEYRACFQGVWREDGSG